MKKLKKVNRLAALFLCLVMFITNLPLTALAVDDTSGSSAAPIIPADKSSEKEEDSPQKESQPEIDNSVSSESTESGNPTSEEPPVSKDEELSEPPQEDSSNYIVVNPKDMFEKNPLIPYDNREEFITTSLARANVYTVELVYDDVQFIEQEFSDGYNEDRWYPKRLRETGEVAYCVEHGVGIPNVYEGGYTPKEVSDEMYQRISLADFYGRTTRGGNALKNEYMVQLYIWEQQGVKVKNLYYKGHPEWAPWVSMAEYNAFKKEIQPKVDGYFKKASFSNTNLKLKPGQTITLTDKNGALANYEDTPALNTSGLIIKKSGNSVTLTATKDSKEGYFTFRYMLPAGFFRGTPIYYNKPTSQDVVVLGRGDPNRLRVNIEIIKEGTLRLVKTSEDGVVAGLQYTITGGGKTYNATTDSAGVISLTLPSVDDNGKKITYTATEVSVPGRYVAPASQTFTIEPETTTTINFQNNLKKGSLKLIKTSEDGILAGLTFQITGGGQTYTKTTNAAGQIDISGMRVLDSSNNKIVYTVKEISIPGRYVVPASQTFSLSENATTTVNFRNNLKKGNLRLIKTSEDGIVSGFTFEITGGGQTYIKTTNAAGQIDVSDMIVFDRNNNLIQYTAKEIGTSLRYIQPVSQTFTLRYGETVTLNFRNNLKKGSLKLIKVSEDDDIAGKQFRITGGGQTWEKTTNNKGEIDVSDMRVYDQNNVKITYTASEINTPIKYVVPPAQTFTLEYGQTTTLYFENILKKWQLTVTKKDSQYNAAQGDATLVGAKYGLFKGDVLLDTYVTDSHNSFTTKIYHCDIDYTLREIEPSPGYLLDPTIYKVGVAPGDTHIELNPRYLTVTEDVIKGKIAIVKHTDNGETQIETPEVGAEFDVYLKSAGSYANAKETERDHLICDEDGYDQTINLPHGVYVVEQTKSWDGRDMLPPFEVYIAKDSKTYRYIINNSFFEGYLKVVKKDAETGNVIPYAGAGFQILDPVGDIVKMRVTYPKHMEIDTFYTSEDGTLITPQKLPYGIGYQLIEVQAPYGYILDSTPVEFDITQDLSEQDNGIDIVKVEKKNLPQMGKVTIVKQGEVLSQITQTDVYQPVYEVQGLFGAEYDLIAMEDVITPDGTVRALAGQIVDTVKTGYTGEITSQGLYLGKYQAVETKAPEGYVLDDTPIEFELTYAGQEVLLSKTKIQGYNERQKVKISLEKIMEQDEKYQAGMNGEILEVQFGLFAAEEITAKDGSIIPTDGLMETVTMTEDGLQSFTTDIPFGKFYIQEIATNEKYILSDTKYPVEFTYQGQDIPVVEIMANEGKSIENTLKRAKVTLTKVDMELPENSLSGAVFEIYQDVDGDEKYTEDTDLLIGSMEEIETGIYEFDRLTHGKYLAYEKTAPVGFIQDEYYYPFEITEDGQVVNLETTPEKGFENQPIKGSVQLTKVDKENLENKLSGAVFEVYQDVDGDGKYNAEMDKLYDELQEEKDGLYQLEGLRYGKYLAYEKVAPVGFVKDTTYYPFEITEDGQIVTLETTPEKGFENQPIRGSIDGKKVSEDGKGLGGALIGLFKADETKYNEKTAIMTATSADDGSFSFSSVLFGKYKAKEIKAPKGYELSEKVIDINITNHEQVVTIEIVNKKIPEKPPVPETGDRSNLVLPFVVLSVSGVGIITIIWKKKHKKV